MWLAPPRPRRDWRGSGWPARDPSTTLRAVVTGRKNWLFAGSDAGGRTAAVLYSFTSTCQRHKLDSFAYLRDLFARMPEHPTERLEELLPDRWAAARPNP